MLPNEIDAPLQAPSKHVANTMNENTNTDNIPAKYVDLVKIVKGDK
jgi:hypothetical protein